MNPFSSACRASQILSAKYFIENLWKGLGSANSSVRKRIIFQIAYMFLTYYLLRVFLIISNRSYIFFQK